LLKISFLSFTTTKKTISLHWKKSPKILNSRTRSDQGQMDQAEDNDIDIDIDKDKRRKSTNSTKHQ